MTLDNNTQIERAAVPPELHVSDAELVLLDVDGGKYFTLHGSVGIRIWELLKTMQSMGNIIDILTDEFDTQKADCEVEARRFIEALMAKGLIRVALPA